MLPSVVQACPPDPASPFNMNHTFLNKNKEINIQAERIYKLIL